MAPCAGSDEEIGPKAACVSDDEACHAGVPGGPDAAPIPNGTTLPNTRMPCLVPYLVTKFWPRIRLTRRMPLIGMAATTRRPRCGPARPATSRPRRPPGAGQDH